MPDDCKIWQGLFAEHALTRLPSGDSPPLDRELARHLEGCAECQSMLAEMSSSTAALRFVERPTQPPVWTEAPAGLKERISARLGRERRRVVGLRTLVAVAAAAAVVVVGVIGLARSPGGPAVAGETVALEVGAVTAVATLQERAWGAQIHFEGDGFTPGQHYNVWLERSDGTRVSAGTFFGVRDTHIMVVLASALSPMSAVAIGISEADGDLVVRQALD